MDDRVLYAFFVATRKDSTECLPSSLSCEQSEVVYTPSLMPVTQKVHFTAEAFFSAISFKTLINQSKKQRINSLAVFGVMVNKLHRKGMVRDSFSCLRCCSATTVYWDRSIDMQTGV